MSVTFLDVFVWKARGQCLSVDNVKMCQYLTETKTNTYMRRNFSTDVFCRVVGFFFSFLFKMKMLGYSSVGRVLA